MVATVTPNNLGPAFDIGVAVPNKITLTPDAVSQSGVGAPTFTPPAGSSPFYVDKNTTPYNLYWYDGLAWHLVGSAPAGAADGTVTAAALSVAKVLSLTRSVGAPVTVDLSALSGGGAGEANTTSNTGTGIGLASPKVGVNLPVKSIKAGAGVTVVDNGLDVTITSTVTGGAADGNISNVALSGTNLTFTGTNGGFNGAVNLASLAGGAGDVTGVTGTGPILITSGTGPVPNVALDMTALANALCTNPAFAICLANKIMSAFTQAGGELQIANGVDGAGGFTFVPCP